MDGRKGTIFIFEEITLVLSGGQIGWSREMQGNYLLSMVPFLPLLTKTFI